MAKSWSKQDEATLVAMRRAGLSAVAIGERLGRTPNAIYRRVQHLGLPPIVGQRVAAPEIKSRIRQMWLNGRSAGRIAAALGITPAAVDGHVRRMGITRNGR